MDRPSSILRNVRAKRSNRSWAAAAGRHAAIFMHLGRLLLRLAGLVLLFGASVEITSRVEDWVRFRTPLLSPYRSQVDLMVRDKDGMHARPNSRFQKWVINNLGFRGPDAAPVKPPGTFRIVVAGASETFGLYEAPDHEYPRQLEDTLKAMLQQTQACDGVIQRFEVLNAAFPGMSLPTVTQDIKNRVRRYGMDVVAYYPTPSQYLWDERPQAALPDSSGHLEDPSWSAAIYPRIWTRMRIQRLRGTISRSLRRSEVASQVQNHPPGWRFEVIPDDRLAAYEADLRNLVGAIRAAGALPALVTQANAFYSRRSANPALLRGWEKYYPRATGPTFLAFDSAAADVTRRVASDSGALLVDWRAVLTDAAPPGLFGDYAHFTDRGAAMLASAIARSLMEALRSGQALCGATVPQAQSKPSKPGTP